MSGPEEEDESRSDSLGEDESMRDSSGEDANMSVS